MTRKVTFYLLILSVLYCFFCFFIIGIVIQSAITFMYEGYFIPSKEKLIDTLFLSGVAGIAAGSGSWIFAKIDEQKTPKPPSSDTK